MTTIMPEGVRITGTMGPRYDEILTPDAVADVHRFGGTILGASRGGGERTDQVEVEVRAHLLQPGKDDLRQLRLQLCRQPLDFAHGVATPGLDHHGIRGQQALVAPEGVAFMRLNGWIHRGYHSDDKIGLDK